jgi:mannosyltransferase
VHVMQSRAQPVAIAAALAVVMAGSLLLRTGALDAGYWIDEAIAVGIASRDFTDIPGALRQDGSPPLYYLLLHGWMAVAGTGEAATRTLSLIFALLAVPVAFWAGNALFGRRAGALAAAGAAGCPFLTYYAQETRMYSLVALLSLLASASFALAFLHGGRRHVPLLGLWCVLLLYTHTWAVFLVTGMAVAWVLLWRAGRVDGRDGAWLGAAVALLYAPWLPTLLFQASHTAAPWASRPSPLLLPAIPGALFGYAALPLLVVAVAGGLRRLDAGARALLAVVAVAAVVAWLASQLQPAWSTRYLAVLLGPLLLGLAAAVAAGRRWSAVAVAGVAAIWLVSAPPAEKSNARTVAAEVAPQLRPGDLVVSTQPEQVPVLYRYLPTGVVYATPMGIVSDPGVTDWRDGVRRLRAGRAERRLLPLVSALPAGRRVLLVTPVAVRRRSHAPWNRAVRARTREWRGALREHPLLRSEGPAPLRLTPRLRTAIRAELFVVRARP